MADLFVAGRIKRPFGVRGWIWIESYTATPSSVLHWAPWFLQLNNDPTIYKTNDRIKVIPEAHREHQKGYVVKLDGYDCRGVVNSFVNCLIEVERKHLPALDVDEFYWRDLEGCRINTLSGVDLGRVDSIFATGSNDVLVVKGSLASVDEKERLIPFTAQCVLSVDLSKKVIRVDWDPDF